MCGRKILLFNQRGQMINQKRYAPISGHAQGAVRYAHHTLHLEIQTTTAYRAL